MSAAAEACSRRSDGTVLKGFWVRNKGFHATAMALGQILPARSDALGIDGMGITPMAQRRGAMATSRPDRGPVPS